MWKKPLKIKQMVSFEKKTVKFPSPIIDLFDLAEAYFGVLDFGGEITISIVKFKNIKSLSESWDELNSYITAHYFSESDNEFSKWNSYLFYLTPTKLDKPLKYDIENNRFSSRKIVLDNFQKELTDETLSDIVGTYIKCSNMNVKVPTPHIDDLVKDSRFSTIIDQLDIPKKGKENSLNVALEQIEKKLRENEV